MKSLLIITAYLAPFFFIPATFRFAGGIFGRISGMANDRTRGLFDKQRKFRQESKQRMRDRVYGGNRLNNPNDSRGRTWVNNALQRGAVRRKLITEGGVRNIGGRTDAEIEEINQRKANEAAQNGPAWSGNDTALWAARRTTRQGIINELTQGEYADTDHYGNGTDSDTAEQRAARERLTDEIMA
ncbi:MAG: hypothetical protein KIH63_005225, partial [Candidatus Saccharibacteria bacterium]|nr:hypothetical protein [Candidatus Saccharibacteria bacterium]